MPEYANAATEYEIYQADLEDQLKMIENDALAKQKLLETESKKPNGMRLHEWNEIQESLKRQDQELERKKLFKE